MTMEKNKLSENEQTLACSILGYLNFSSGRFDVQFIKAWDNFYQVLSQNNSSKLWQDAIVVLESELEHLEQLGGAFSDSVQARKVLNTLKVFLPAYRNFHQDSLFSVDDSYLFNSFFMAKSCRIILTNFSAKYDSCSLSSIIEQLNDYLGYRPIPVLEGEKHEPNSHEWIAPLPLYYDCVGVAWGKYHNVIEKTLEIIRNTNPCILHDASFVPEKLRELSVDPRTYDFDHPVNRRVNYSFGTWDERCIDKNGYFRRFIVHRVILDGIMNRVWNERNSQLRSEYEYEAAAVLAGTMLMASGISGGHIQSHDSTVSLSTLTPVVATYRDRFYEELLVQTPEPIKSRLLKEEELLFQPFAGARQCLNQYIAKKRADQLQRCSLARIYAHMGYFEEAKRQASVIETSSARFFSQIDCYITQVRFAANVGKIEEASNYLFKINDLLHRGIECGAFPDPWSILGFDAQFNLFPAVENGIHDHRLDDLIDLLNEIFDLYSRLQKEAAVRGNSLLRLELSDQMSELADWWDQFGSLEVSSVEGFSGQEIWKSAGEVSRALEIQYQSIGKGNRDISFWKRHVNLFKTPKAFVLLCEALLENDDLKSSSTLLIYWLSQSEKIPLVEGNYSFHSIVCYWMEKVWNAGIQKNEKLSSQLEFVNSCNMKRSEDGYLCCWKMVTKFLDYFGENAGNYWIIPKMDMPSERFERKLGLRTNNPILAELTRRLLLSVKYVGKTELGVPKIKLKASFKDAVRDVDLQNLPTPDEFKRFYDNNKSVFPNFLTFDVFMQIVLNEIPMPLNFLSSYRRAIFRGDPFVLPNSQIQQQCVENQNCDVESVRKKGDGQAKSELTNKVVGADSIQDLANMILEKNNQQINSLRFLFSQQDSSEGVVIEKDENIDGEGQEEFESDKFFLPESNDGDKETESKTVTGGDPIFSAAYENMIFCDSADDGLDEETFSGKFTSKDWNESEEFARETNRISERLTFIVSTVKLWRFTAIRSPLLTYFSKDTNFDDSVLVDSKLRLEDWLNQTVRFKKGLYELLDQVSRFRIFLPSGTTDSLVEYDQIRGTKEILLDRVIETLVEVEDTLFFLKATLNDETTTKFAKPWNLLIVKVFSALLRRDVQLVRQLWPSLLNKLETRTLLYIPTTRGGEARTIVDCRQLQQVVLYLLRYAPKIGLLFETFQLIGCVQKMEQIRLSSPGAITEYDRFVEVATRSITETLAESSILCCSESKNLPVLGDQTLVSYLVCTVNVILRFWLSHSQQIRVSTVETIVAESRWQMIKIFIQNYGADLFTQDFLAFRNIRAILHQGTVKYLSSLVSMKNTNHELDAGNKVVTAIMEGKEKLEHIAGVLEIIIECVAENYSEYVDYNSTTTQSDRGDRLYIFLDFLRVLSSYERILWNLKPVYWIHDSLIRTGHVKVAKVWKNRIKQKSFSLAESSLHNYSQLTRMYGIGLTSIRERLSERFIRPLDIAQMCGLVSESITAVKELGENNTIFKELERTIENLAATSVGVGFELPEWLICLQSEVTFSCENCKRNHLQNGRLGEDSVGVVPSFPIISLSRVDIERQLQKALAYSNYVSKNR